MTKEKHAGGRPTKYTEELAAKFCDYVATNALSLKRICVKYKDELPDQTTISEWLGKNHEFRLRYLKAKELQALIITDELWDEVEFIEGKEQLEIYDRKFRFHQWHLSKLAPKQFGDKKQVEQDIKIKSWEETLSHLK